MLDNFTAVQLIALVALLISACVFYYYGIASHKSKVTLDGYLLNDGNVDANSFANTFASSSLSLASVMVFFLSLHSHFGIFIVLDTISYVAGQFLFLHFAKKIKIDFSKIRTVSDFLYSIFPSKKIARAVAVIMATSFIAILFSELYVGSIILSIFLPDSPLYHWFAFFSIGLVVIAYVHMGGYRAIIKTDTWQLWLIIGSTVSILLFTLMIPHVPDANETFIAKLLSVEASTKELWIFLTWLVLINITLPFAQLSNWQRIAASKSTDEAWLGIKRSVGKVLVIFLMPAVCFLIISAKGYEFNSLDSFLTLVHNEASTLGYIVFPLIVVGFGATLFSTADTSLIAVAYALTDSQTLRPYLQGLAPERRSQFIQRAITFFAIVILLLMSIFYWVQMANLASWFLPILFCLFGQMSVLVPLVLVGMYSKDTGLVYSTKIENNLLLSLLAAWLLVIAGGVQDYRTGDDIWSMMSLPIGMLVVLFAALQLKKRPHNDKLASQHSAMLI